MTSVIEPRCIRGRLLPPGDKSITHRALIFAAMANGQSTVRQPLVSEDTLATVACLRQLGVIIEQGENFFSVESSGWQNFTAPPKPLDCKNSGTTMRLLMGLLAGMPFDSELMGDASLSARPMSRVAEPLSKLGARISLSGNNFSPLTIVGTPLQGRDVKIDVASAQLKSALLLAGMVANGKTIISGTLASRDHSERMLPLFSVVLNQQSEAISLQGPQRLKATDIDVPGDFSSAIFFVVAALITPGSKLAIESLSLNPSRCHAIDVLRRMGANIELSINQWGSEPVGNLAVQYSELIATEIKAEEVPFVIDDIPALVLAATQAKGETRFYAIDELRVKESDRVAALVDGFSRLGATIADSGNYLSVIGKQALQGASVSSYGDHRIAMTLSIANLISQREIVIDDINCIDVSYPSFFKDLERLMT